MDPDATLRDIRECLRGGDYETARDHARDLTEWLDKGGFPPAGSMGITGLRAVLEFVDSLGGR